MHLNTKLIHGAYAPEETTGATTMPIFQTASFAYGSAEELEAVFEGRGAGYVYSRINNPTLDRFERRLATLEDGIPAFTLFPASAGNITILGQGHGYGFRNELLNSV